MTCGPGAYLLESMTFQLEPKLPARFLRALLDCHVQALVNGKVVAYQVIRELRITADFRILFPIDYPVKPGDKVIGKMLSAGLVAPSCGFKVDASVSVLCAVPA